MSTSPLPSINPRTHPPPFFLQSWIDEHQSLLQPPVNNAMIYGAGAQFKLMVIGGPNLRTDYHINLGEEWSTTHRHTIPHTPPHHSNTSIAPQHSARLDSSSLSVWWCGVVCACVRACMCRFHQLKGDMVLKVVDGGVMKDVVIREGDNFLLPPNTPHSPQRLANTFGLVMERERDESELDGLRWYCAKCQAVVYEEYFHCEDLGKQLKEKIQAYYGDTNKRTCKACGTVDEVPQIDRDRVKTVEDIIASTRRGRTLPDKEPLVGAAASVDRVDHSAFSSVIVPSSKTTSEPPHTSINPATHPVPFSLPRYIAEHSASLRPPVSNQLLFGGLSCEYQIQIVGGPNNRTDFHVEEGEEWFWQLRGDMTLRVVDGGEVRDVEIREGQSFLLPPRVPHSPQRRADTVGLVIERRRKEEWEDGLRWYCRQPGCGEVVYEDRFRCVDLGSQLKVLIEGYYGDEGKRRCSRCGKIDEPPTKAGPAKVAQPVEAKEEEKESKER